MSLGFRKSFGSTPTGTISGGAVSQILGVGMVDSHFTGKADHSFFRGKIKQHNNFACEMVSQSFMGNINWGQEVSLTANKTPDIMANVFAVIDRPGIYAKLNGNLNGNLSGSSGSQRASSRGSRPGATSSRFKAPSKQRAAGQGRPRSKSAAFPAQRARVSQTSSAAPTTRRSNQRPLEPTVDQPDEDFDPNTAFWDEVDDWEDEQGDAFEVEEGQAGKSGIPKVYAHWVNNLGHAAIARSTISLAGMLGQLLTGRFISAFTELAGIPGKEQDDLIGAYDNLGDLIAASAVDDRLYVQIPFTFTRYTGRHLSLISMRFHGVNLSLALTSLHKLIKVSHPNVTVLKTADDQPITKQDVEAHLDIEYIFLDLEERKRFARSNFSLMWEQLQIHEATYKGATVRAPLNFRHPSRCLIFMVQRKSLEDQNETFDYSSPVPGEDPVQFAKLIVNTTPRFAREGAFFRKVMPFAHFPMTLKRNRFIYCMPFGLDPTAEQSNGTLNFSRSDNSTLNLEMHPDMADEAFMLYVYNISLNVVTFKRGLVNIEYS
jgi:Large eukaryotic DNA virus major capsid protein/Major capsid protein N-terminus